MFKNDLGQEINVGDKVAVITISSKRFKMVNGTFLGQTKNGKCKVEVEATRNEYRYTDTNEIIDWRSFNDKRPRHVVTIPYLRKTTLRLNRMVKLA